MLALSVKQPWTELIASGKKKKEFRTWSRSSFGERTQPGARVAIGTIGRARAGASATGNPA